MGDRADVIFRRTRGDQRVHCASVLKVDASDLALTPRLCIGRSVLSAQVCGDGPRPPAALGARGRPWASKPLPIDYEQCCSDQLNPQPKADKEADASVSLLCARNRHYAADLAELKE